MKEDTGRLMEMTAEEAKKLNEERGLLPGKQWIPVPQEDLQDVRHMNRKQRRTWAKRQRSRA